MPSPTILSSLALLLWQALREADCDPTPLFIEAGLSPEALRQPGARYPWLKLQPLWTRAAEVSQNSAIGLTAAALWHPTSLHALGFAWLASSTLKEGFERLVRYSGVGSDAAQVSLSEETDAYRVSLVKYQELSENYSNEALDATIALFAQMCRVSAGPEISPVLVVASRPTPADIAPYQDFFRAQLQFGAGENYLLFRKSDLDAALPTGNAELARANEKVVVSYLSRVESQRFDISVHQKLIELLPRGDISQPRLAHALHVSARTLQRKLRDAGTTYVALVDEVRQELAQDYVRDSRHSLSEIAYLLGFSDQASFSRAFKRWTGTPPGRYRANGGD